MVRIYDGVQVLSPKIMAFSATRSLRSLLQTAEPGMAAVSAVMLEKRRSGGRPQDRKR
jgi:hypothetical protein